MTISPAPAAAAADAAALPPFTARRSTASDTRSKPVTRCPALTRLAAIGAPILPSPINPIIAIYGFLPRDAAARIQGARSTPEEADRRRPHRLSICFLKLHSLFTSAAISSGPAV